VFFHVFFQVRRAATYGMAAMGAAGKGAALAPLL
jgi:hypothetical protein